MKIVIHPLARPVRDFSAEPDQRLILRLRVSLAHLLVHGDELAANFYSTLFHRYPKLRPMFPLDMTEQWAKLTEMLAWIVASLDNPERTLAGIADLGRRHSKYGLKPEHYPLFRDTLLETMAKAAGAEWDEEIAQDWRQSMDLITQHMLAAAMGDAAPARPAIRHRPSTAAM